MRRVKNIMNSRTGWFVALMLVIFGSPQLLGQLGRIGIELTPVNESDVAHAGATARVAVRAKLDPGFHTNSDTPRDELLIPTVFRLEPPDGITVDGLAFPEPSLLEQEGADEPLEVFDEEFTIGVVLSLGPICRRARTPSRGRYGTRRATRPCATSRPPPISRSS